MKLKKLLVLLLMITTLIGSGSVNVYAKETVKTANATMLGTVARSNVNKSYNKADVRLLTAITYCEAGYEDYKGKVAVANVILNRVDSDVFDHVTSIRTAVYDLKRWGRQFSPAYVKTPSGNYTTKGSLLEKALKLYTEEEYTSSLQKEMMEECERAAIEALEGKNVIGDYLYFNAHINDTIKTCKKNNKPYTIIGGHIFY